MSELDNDELLATRRLHGLNDNLFKDGNDTNVGSIEEDIKILESMLEEYYSCSVPGMNMHIDIYFSLEQAEAIEHILAKREQNKKRIKELEESNRIYALNGSNIKLELYIKENYIPVQKVKETVKEVIELIESEQFKIIMGDMTKVGRIKYLLEKLLEEK